MTDEVPSKECIVALYNLTLAVNSSNEAQVELKATMDIGEFADALLSLNVSSRLVEHWGEEVEKQCNIEWDSKLAEGILKKEQEVMIPYVRALLEQGLAYDPDFERKQADKSEKEAEGVLYG